MKKKIQFKVYIKKKRIIRHKEYSFNNNYHKILCTFKQVKWDKIQELCMENICNILI